MRLLVTRPRADAERLARLLDARGHDCLCEPLLTIEPLPAALSLEGVQALAATSRNGVEAFVRQEPRRDLPVYAVGSATAAAARRAGFATVLSAAGDANSLAALLARRLRPAAGAILHLAGERVAADLGLLLADIGLAVRRVSLYRARAAEAFSPAVEAALRESRLEGATFLSPRTATTFVRLVQASGLEAATQRMVAFCLSPAVAAALEPLPWAAIEAAREPTLAALLDTIAATA